MGIGDVQVSLTIKYEVKAIEENEPVRGNVGASGDAVYDKEVEDEIIERLDSGDLFAWCCAEVTAVVEIEGQRFMGRDYLSCISVKDRKEFECLVMGHGMHGEARADLLNYLNNEVKRGHLARKAIMMLNAEHLKENA